MSEPVPLFLWGATGMLGGELLRLLETHPALRVEVAVSRRWWCRYVCPGGGLYSLIGGWRIVRIKRCAEKCTLGH